MHLDSFGVWVAVDMAFYQGCSPPRGEGWSKENRRIRKTTASTWSQTPKFLRNLQTGLYYEESKVTPVILLVLAVAPLVFTAVVLRWFSWAVGSLRTPKVYSCPKCLLAEPSNVLSPSGRWSQADRFFSLMADSVNNCGSLAWLF